MIKIYFDGGTALNAVCFYDENRKFLDYLPIQDGRTNNELEYTALFEAVRYAFGTYKNNEAIKFIGDSQLVIYTMIGDKVLHKKHLKVIQNRIKNIFIANGITGPIDYYFRWVPRSENLAGVALEQKLDRRRNEKLY